MAAWLFVKLGVFSSIISLQISMDMCFCDLLHEKGPVANKRSLKMNINELLRRSNFN